MMRFINVVASKNCATFEQAGRRVLHVLQSTTRKAVRMESEILVLTGTFVLLSGAAWIVGYEITGARNVYGWLSIIVVVLKSFAPIMTVLLGLSLLLNRLFPPQKSLGRVKDLGQTIGWVRDILTPNVRGRTANRKDVPWIAGKGDEEFGRGFISPTDRHTLFLSWHVIHGRCMSVVELKEEPNPVGYAIVLPLEESSAQHLMRGELSQFDLIRTDIREQSQFIFIQGVCVAAEERSLRLATIALFRELSVMIEDMIADPDDAVTLFFDEYSESSARLARRYGFEKLKTRSAEGHSIWRKTTNGRLIFAKSNVIPFPPPPAVERKAA